MKKTIGPHVFVPDFTGTATHATYTRVSAKDVRLYEEWFRDAIFANPELVIEPCREAGLVPADETWEPWVTEFSVGAGPMDVLLLASSGRVGIVETKLSYNPQKRREVVAQILDYALALQEADALPPWPTNAAPDERDVRERISRGEFLLVIAGDEIDPRALRLGEAVLAGHLTSEWDLAMIDLNVYQSAAADPRHLLIPELRGVLRHETRQVVRVITEGDKTRVKVERLAAPSEARTTRDWDEANFFEYVKTRVDAETAKAIHDGYETLGQDGYTITWGHGGKVGSFNASDPSCSWKDVFSFDSDGKLWISFRSLTEHASTRIRSALAELGFSVTGKQFIGAKAADWRPRLTQIFAAFNEVRFTLKAKT